MNASFADNSQNTAPDYVFPPSGGEPESTSPRTADFGDGNIAFVELRVKDYGGRTKVRAVASTGQESNTMSLPRDGGNNWLPDVGWWAATGTGAELVPDNVTDPWSDADGDIGPIGSPVPPDDVPLNHGWYGDGLIRFHEYRGFVVRGTHIRTDPRRLDIFMSHNVRDNNGVRLPNALDFAKTSLNQFRITAYELFDETEGATARFGRPLRMRSVMACT